MAEGGSGGFPPSLPPENFLKLICAEIHFETHFEKCYILCPLTGNACFMYTDLDDFSVIFTNML